MSDAPDPWFTLIALFLILIGGAWALALVVLSALRTGRRRR